MRFYCDVPTTDAKYKDAFMVQHLIYPVMVDVLARLNLNQDNPITIRHSVALDSDTEYYLLPPNVQEIWRLAVLDSNGRITKEAYPRGVFNPSGPGWSIQGNVLQMLPKPTADETVDIWYIPSGDVLCHYGTGSLRNKVFTLASAPTYGLVDRRPNAYAGAILRLLPSSGAIQERIIESYDVDSRTVTVRVPFTLDASGGSSSSSGAGSSESSSSSGGFSDTYVYEIAPCASQPMYEAISLGCALKLGAATGASEKKIAFLEKEYMKAMKTIKDNLANLQMRNGKAFDRDTVDHPANRFLFP